MKINSITIELKPNDDEAKNGDLKRLIIRNEDRSWTCIQAGQMVSMYPAEIALISRLQEHVIQEWSKIKS